MNKKTKLPGRAITRSEALRIARRILVRAEFERWVVATREAQTYPTLPSLLEILC